MKVTAQTRLIELPPDFQKRDLRQILKLVFLWILWGTAIVAVDRLYAIGRGPAISAAVTLGVLTGFFAVAGIGFIGHDVAHGGVVAGERAMRFWTFCSLTAVLFVPYFLWVRWHNAFHHRYANTPRDSDRLIRVEDIESGVVSYPAYRLMNLTGFSLQYVAFRLWRIVYGPKIGGAKRETGDRKKRADLGSLGLVIALYAATGALLPGSTFVLGVVLPVLVSLVTVSFYIQSNHFSRPITSSPDPVKNSADVTCPPPMDFFHSHFSNHTAHHLFPSLPSRHYPWVTQRIKTVFAADYKSENFFVTVWENITLPKIVRAGKYLVNRRGEVFRELT